MNDLDSAFINTIFLKLCTEIEIDLRLLNKCAQWLIYCEHYLKKSVY